MNYRPIIFALIIMPFCGFGMVSNEFPLVPYGAEMRKPSLHRMPHFYPFSVQTKPDGSKHYNITLQDGPRIEIYKEITDKLQEFHSKNISVSEEEMQWLKNNIKAFPTKDSRYIFNPNNNDLFKYKIIVTNMDNPLPSRTSNIFQPKEQNLNRIPLQNESQEIWKRFNEIKNQVNDERRNIEPAFDEIKPIGFHDTIPTKTGSIARGIFGTVLASSVGLAALHFVPFVTIPVLAGIGYTAGPRALMNMFMAPIFKEQELAKQTNKDSVDFWKKQNDFSKEIKDEKDQPVFIPRSERYRPELYQWRPYDWKNGRWIFEESEQTARFFAPEERYDPKLFRMRSYDWKTNKWLPESKTSNLQNKFAIKPFAKDTSIGMSEM